MRKKNKLSTKAKWIFVGLKILEVGGTLLSIFLINLFGNYLCSNYALEGECATHPFFAGLVIIICAVAIVICAIVVCALLYFLFELVIDENKNWAKKIEKKWFKK